MPRATEILEHISVHAARALDRWEAQLGKGPRDFILSAKLSYSAITTLWRSQRRSTQWPP